MLCPRCRRAPLVLWLLAIVSGAALLALFYREPLAAQLAGVAKVANNDGPMPPTLVVYVFSNSDLEYEDNLRFFVQWGMGEGDGCDYVIVIQHGDGLKARAVYLNPCLRLCADPVAAQKLLASQIFSVKCTCNALHNCPGHWWQPASQSDCQASTSLQISVR